MRWITRERPKIDRVVCPWLIARFVDPAAEFHFAAPADVRRLADELNATPFDVEGVELSHDGPLCSFDAILRKYTLTDPVLHEQLRHGFVLYDALYAWARDAKSETHTWNPQRAR